MIHTLALCGFMGCGKTTVGKEAARQLGWRFLDLDDFINEREGMTISEIFSKYGESGFRQRENRALQEILSTEDAVLALGGGTVLFQNNIAVLHRSGARIVLLDAPLPVLQRRLRRDTQRPLLQRPDRETFINQLFAQRMPLYRAASDAVVRITGVPEKTAALLVELVRSPDRALEQSDTT